MTRGSVLDDLRRCIALEKPSRVPCFPLGLEFDIHESGFSHRQFRDDPEVMVEVGLNAVRNYDYDWFILHPDDLIEYEGIGITVKYEENIPPAVLEYLPPTPSTLAGLRLPARASDNPRMALHLEALAGLRAKLGDTVCLAGRIAAPFSSVTLILGVAPTLSLMVDNPKLLVEFMRFLIEYNDTYARAQLEAGAHALWLGDCVATSHFISSQHYRDFAAEYADESAKRIRQAGGMVFYHGCERSIPHLEIMADLPFDTINIGEGVDIGDVKRAIGARMCIMGNLDTINVLREKSPLQVEQETKAIVEKGKAGGGYIFCTGEDIPGDTPRQNVRAMVSAVRRYGGPCRGVAQTT